MYHSLFKTKNARAKCNQEIPSPHPSLPVLCTLVDTDVIHIQAFPLHFCTLQVIKNWMVGRPGKEAKSDNLAIYYACIIGWTQANI